jgi:hypothetical protein
VISATIAYLSAMMIVVGGRGAAWKGVVEVRIESRIGVGIEEEE